MQRRNLGSLLLLTGLFVFGLPSIALAAGGGGALPWDGVLAQILASMQGPVAQTGGTIAVIIFGLTMAFGGGGGGMRTAVGILFGLSIVFAAGTFITTLFGAGAGFAIG